MASQSLLRTLCTIPFFLSGALSHMQMQDPSPLRDPHSNREPKDYNILNPLKADGSDFSCKGFQWNTPLTSVATYNAGKTYEMKLKGGATHGGGSCQISLSCDQGVHFKVLKSIIGGCPLQSTYDFQIPKDAETAQCLLAWTWFNKVGNREMYMNCAVVDIVGARSKHKRFIEDVKNSQDSLSVRSSSAAAQAALSRLPDLYVANLKGINNCQTKETTNPIFGDPGNNVVYGDGVTASTAHSTSTNQCKGIGHQGSPDSHLPSSVSSSSSSGGAGDSGQWHGSASTQRIDGDSSISDSSKSPNCQDMVKDGLWHPECYGQHASPSSVYSAAPMAAVPTVSSQPIDNKVPSPLNDKAAPASSEIEKEVAAYVQSLGDGDSKQGMAQGSMSNMGLNDNSPTRLSPNRQALVDSSVPLSAEVDSDPLDRLEVVSDVSAPNPSAFVVPVPLSNLNSLVSAAGSIDNEIIRPSAGHPVVVQVPLERLHGFTWPVASTTLRTLIASSGSPSKLLASPTMAKAALSVPVAQRLPTAAILPFPASEPDTVGADADSVDWDQESGSYDIPSDPWPAFDELSPLSYAEDSSPDSFGFEDLTDFADSSEYYLDRTPSEELSYEDDGLWWKRQELEAESEPIETVYETDVVPEIEYVPETDIPVDDLVEPNVDEEEIEGQDDATISPSSDEDSTPEADASSEMPVDPNIPVVPESPVDPEISTAPGTPAGVEKRQVQVNASVASPEVSTIAESVETPVVALPSMVDAIQVAPIPDFTPKPETVSNLETIFEGSLYLMQLLNIKGDSAAPAVESETILIAAQPTAVVAAPVQVVADTNPEALFPQAVAPAVPNGFILPEVLPSQSFEFGIHNLEQKTVLPQAPSAAASLVIGGNSLDTTPEVPTGTEPVGDEQNVQTPDAPLDDSLPALPALPAISIGASFYQVLIAAAQAAAQQSDLAAVPQDAAPIATLTPELAAIPEEPVPIPAVAVELATPPTRRTRKKRQMFIWGLDHPSALSPEGIDTLPPPFFPDAILSKVREGSDPSETPTVEQHRPLKPVVPKPNSVGMLGPEADEWFSQDPGFEEGDDPWDWDDVWDDMIDEILSVDQPEDPVTTTIWEPPNPPPPTPPFFNNTFENGTVMTNCSTPPPIPTESPTLPIPSSTDDLPEPSFLPGDDPMAPVSILPYLMGPGPVVPAGASINWPGPDNLRNRVRPTPVPSGFVKVVRRKEKDAN